LETELEKFDKNDETFVNVDGVKYQKESGGKVNSIDNEYSVVMTNFFSVNEMLVCFYSPVLFFLLSSLIITFVS
jgi:hypothetical protein